MLAGFFLRKSINVAQRAEVLQPRHEDTQQDDEQPSSRPHLLSGIHALDNITVNDILIPRNEVEGLNLDEPIENLIEQLRQTQRTRLPVFDMYINLV